MAILKRNLASERAVDNRNAHQYDCQQQKKHVGVEGAH
jgi:hypothetical protein